MIKRCRNAGLAEPEFALTDGFVTTIRRKPERVFEAVGGEVTLSVEKGPSRDQVLRPLLESGLLEMTIPDKPQSSGQKYRLTEKGKTHLAALRLRAEK